MENTTFIQNSSLIRWLKIIIAIVAIFILLGILIQYLTTKPYLDTIRQVSEANRILSFTSQLVELLNSSKKNLDEALEGKDSRLIKVAFMENKKKLNRTLDMAIKESEKITIPLGNLKAVESEIKNYETSVESFLIKLESYPVKKNKMMLEKLTSELLVVNEYYSDIKEQLIKAQINLRMVSDSAFDRVYKARHRPLVFATLLALAFFSYVLVAGFSVTKRIQDSIYNLMGATDLVATGNLNYRAPILNQDEIGKLTDAFNGMVSSLEESQQELARLNKVRLEEERERTFIIFKNAERLNAIIESSLDAVIGMNNQGIITNWNSQAEKIFGHTRQDAIGGNLASLIIPKQFQEAHKKGLEKFLSGGNGPILNQRVELTALYQGEREFPAEVSVVPIEENNSWHFYAFIRDISQLKEIERRQKNLLIEEHHARKAAELTLSMQDDFLSIAAHELKTPITPISMQLQLLERTIVKVADNELPLKNNLLKLTHNSKKEIDRLSRLIEELLDVSRISAGRLVLNLEEVNFSQLVQSQLSRYHGAAQKAGSILHVSIEPKIVGMWDQSRLESMVENLLTNAIKYGNGGAIEVKLERHGDFARFMVQDHGIGISKDDQGRIFRKFERAASFKNYSGLGLGLYITKEIVKAFQGTINMVSEFGEGSTFTVEIPLKPSAQVYTETIY